MVEQVAARYPAPLPVALMLCGLLTACGDRIPAPPGAPGTASPTPPASNPSPAVTSGGFLHVLQHPWVMTYEIDPTGRLRPPVTERLSEDLYALADEPKGRFVFAARGDWSVLRDGSGDGSDAKIVTYMPDPRDGTLSQLSEITVEQRPADSGGYALDEGAWVWLKAGANRVHALWRRTWSYPYRSLTSFTYVSVAVARDGRLGPMSRQTFPNKEDPGHVLVDARSDVLYKEGSSYAARGGLEAHSIEPDGTLTRMGWTNLCLAQLVYSSRPLVSARGFLFTSPWNVPTVCAYQGPRLKPLYALDLSADTADAFVPSSEAEPALLAMSVTIPTGGTPRPELRLFAMNGEGDLRPLASEELPDPMKQLLFHPSGRFLFGVDAGGGLRAYRVDSDGRLELLMSIAHAGGSMAISLKDAPAEDP